MSRILAIAAADARIRFRRTSTVVLFLLLSGLAYVWVPSPATGRALMRIGNARALYNSAAIAMCTALLGAFFIGLAGFYVVSNAVRRDAPAVPHALERRDVPEKLLGGEIVVDAEVLREVAEARAQRIGMSGEVFAAPEDAARGRARDRGDHLHQRRLAGPVRAEEPDHAAGARSKDSRSLTRKPRGRARSRARARLFGFAQDEC